MIDLGRSSRMAVLPLVIGLVMLAAPDTVRAETKEIRISQQFGLTWLVLHVMLDQEMIQKRARELGLGDVAVTLRKFSGGPVANEALLSGNVDIAGAGGPPAMILHDRTLGRQNVRAIASVVDAPISLVTTDPDIKSLRDLGSDDRIALPAPRVSVNAMIIQMEAAKLFGPANASRFDAIQVGMPHPDAAAALISGNREIRNYMGIFPYVDEVLEKASGARVILSSFDVLGGPHNLAVLSCTEKWKTENPKTFRAVALALEDAMDFINADKRRAAGIFVKATNPGMTVEQVTRLIDRPDVIFATTPRKTMAFAEFMYNAGTLKNKPVSWKNYFWENVHDKPGD